MKSCKTPIAQHATQSNKNNLGQYDQALVFLAFQVSFFLNALAILFYFIFYSCVDGGTLQHLQRFLQCIKYIIKCN
jgi:hypothetical protein